MDYTDHYPVGPWCPGHPASYEAPNAVDKEACVTRQIQYRDSNIWFRYYTEASTPRFSPAGGPKDGGTVVTFTGKGYYNFVDEDLTVKSWTKGR